MNAVIVGWGGNGGAGNIDYRKSASTTRVVGAEVGLIIDKLVRETSATYGRMYCMGHSLGGHTCGHAGRAASGNVGRITGKQIFNTLQTLNFFHKQKSIHWTRRN